MGTGLSPLNGDGETRLPRGCDRHEGGRHRRGTLPSRAKALVAPQPPGPGRGSGRSCRRCRIPEKPPPPAAGASRRWQVRSFAAIPGTDVLVLTPLRWSLADRAGRGRLCSPRGAGDRCQPGPPRPRLRAPPGPPVPPRGSASWAPHGTKTGTAPPGLTPTSLRVPRIPPDPRAAPGAGPPPQRGERRAPGASEPGGAAAPDLPLPSPGAAGQRAGHRSLVPSLAQAPGTGTSYRGRAPEHCNETVHGNRAPKPSTGASHRSRSPELYTGSAGPHCGAGPCRFPHFRRGTGETKIPTIERKAQPRHRHRHPRHSRSRSRCRRRPRVPSSPPPLRGAIRPWPRCRRWRKGRTSPASAPRSLRPAPSVVPGSCRAFPPEKRVPGGRWGRSRRKRIRGSGGSGERRGPTGGSGAARIRSSAQARHRRLRHRAQHVGAALDPAPVCSRGPTLNRPGLPPKAAGLRGAAPVRPRRSVIPGRTSPHGRERSARRCPVPAAVGRRTAAADSSAPGTGTALPGLHRAPGSATGTGYRERHRTSRIPGLPWAPAPSTGAGASGAPTGASNRRKHRRWHRRWHRAPSRGSIGKRHREPAPVPGADRLPGAAAREPALAAAASQPCRAHRHRGPVPAPGTEPRAPAPRGAQRCHRRWTEPGPPHRIPVPSLVRGGHRLPGPGGDTRGAQPRYISAAAPRAAHSGGGNGAGTAGGGTGGARPGAPRCPRGRKESGEGGGVNIEYLLIAVEGRSVITASPRSHRRRLVTADESWRGRHRERAAGASGGAGRGGGRCMQNGRAPGPRPERRRRRAGSGRRGRGPGTGTGERDRRPARGGLAYRWP
ncbi:collagen alpha-1(III) chain-like [Melospiza melodia melodia]|uniref:collagen alpha-1(III) chain-like n=1 Tax=Melospiza melodia melodia TaxID=1914991 RepID=UPI002FD03593